MPELLDFGKNTVFILACYGLSVAIIAILTGVTLRHRAKAKKLLRLAEAKTKS